MSVLLSLFANPYHMEQVKAIPQPIPFALHISFFWKDIWIADKAKSTHDRIFRKRDTVPWFKTKTLSGFDHKRVGHRLETWLFKVFVFMTRIQSYAPIPVNAFVPKSIHGYLKSILQNPIKAKNQFCIFIKLRNALFIQNVCIKSIESVYLGNTWTWNVCEKCYQPVSACKLFICVSFLLTFGFGFLNCQSQSTTRTIWQIFCGSILVFCHLFRCSLMANSIMFHTPNTVFESVH